LQRANKNQAVYLFCDEGSNMNDARVTESNIMTRQGWTRFNRTLWNGFVCDNI